jgi:hypothetical protein
MHRMATYKRRIVYLSDKEWAEIAATARGMDMTASAYIRTLILGTRIGSPVTVTTRLDADGYVVGRRKAQQAERDAILRRVNRGEG